MWWCVWNASPLEGMNSWTLEPVHVGNLSGGHSQATGKQHQALLWIRWCLQEGNAAGGRGNIYIYIIIIYDIYIYIHTYTLHIYTSIYLYDSLCMNGLAFTTWLKDKACLEWQAIHYQVCSCNLHQIYILTFLDWEFKVDDRVGTQARQSESL